MSSDYGDIPGGKIDDGDHMPLEGQCMTKPDLDGTMRVPVSMRQEIGFPTLSDMQDEPPPSKYEAFGGLTMIAADKISNYEADIMKPDLAYGAHERDSVCFSSKDNKLRYSGPPADGNNRPDLMIRDSTEQLVMLAEQTFMKSTNSDTLGGIDIHIACDQIPLLPESLAPLVEDVTEGSGCRCSHGSKVISDCSCSCSNCTNSSDGDLIQDLSEIAAKLDLSQNKTPDSPQLTSDSPQLTSDRPPPPEMDTPETTRSKEQAYADTSELEDTLDETTGEVRKQCVGLPSVSDHAWNFGERIGLSSAQEVYRSSQEELSKDDLALNKKSVIIKRPSSKDPLHRTSEIMNLHQAEPTEDLCVKLSAPTLHETTVDPLSQHSTETEGRTRDWPHLDSLKLSSEFPTSQSNSQFAVAVKTDAVTNAKMTLENCPRLEAIREESVKFDEMGNNEGADNSDPYNSVMEIVSEVSTENDVVSCASDQACNKAGSIQEDTSIEHDNTAETKPVLEKNKLKAVAHAEAGNSGLEKQQCCLSQAADQIPVKERDGKAEVYAMANGMNLAEDIIYGSEGEPVCFPDKPLTTQQQTWVETPAIDQDKNSAAALVFGVSPEKSQFKDAVEAVTITPPAENFQDAACIPVLPEDNFADAPELVVLHQKSGVMMAPLCLKSCSDEDTEFQDSLQVLVDRDEFSDALGEARCHDLSSNIAASEPHNGDSAACQLQDEAGEDFYDSAELSDSTDQNAEWSDAPVEGKAADNMTSC